MIRRDDPIMDKEPENLAVQIKAIHCPSEKDDELLMFANATIGYRCCMGMICSDLLLLFNNHE